MGKNVKLSNTSGARLPKKAKLNETELVSDGSTLNLSSVNTYKPVGGAAGNPGGTNTEVQFNDEGVFGGSAGFLFDKYQISLNIGNGNTIIGSSYANIIGGNCNQIISDIQNSTIVGGRGNILASATTHSSIIGSDDSRLYSSSSSSILGGAGNKLYCSNFSSTIGGYRNTLSASTRSAIIGGSSLILSNHDNMVMVPNIIVANIPTSDPGIPGQLWRSGSTIQISL